MAAPGTRDVDLVVVGAGLAGLAAAGEAAGAGCSVLVLEARERVGGRVLNEDIGGGQVVEVGGQWIGPTQDRLAAIATDVGVDTFPTWSEGENLIEYGGRLRRYTGTIPAINPLVLLEFERAQRRLNRLAKRVPLEAPWEAPRAARLDGQTAASWMRRNVALEARPHAARTRHRGDLGGSAGGHLAPAHPVLHPLGGQPGAALRHRGRRPAGPLRGRLPAGADPDGGAARRGTGCGRRASAGHTSRRQRGGDRGSRRRLGASPSRHRGGRPHARRPSRVRPAPPRLPRPAHPTHAARHGGQVHGDLRRAVLA